MTTCLITRTQPGAQVTQAQLQALGHEAIVVPVAIISPTYVTIECAGVQALLMTSAAAARHAVINPQLAALPVYGVGDATAEAATQAGFTNVISAGGDGATLAVLAADRMKTDDGALLHLRGNEVAGDVTGMLTACGFETRSVEVYNTRDHPNFQDEVCRYLLEKTGFVLFHSPAGARRFANAIENKHVDLDAWSALGLSPACLASLQDKGFAHLISASQPDESALMEVVTVHAKHSGT